MRSPLAVSLVVLAAFGCGAAQRKPIFDFGTGPSRPAARPRPEAPPPTHQPPSPRPIVLQPPARPLVADTASVPSESATREEIELLVARLRGGKTGERKQVLDRLVALGDSARPDLERALEDATFEADVLSDALDRIRSRSPEAAPRRDTALGVHDRKHSVASPWVEAKYKLALEKFLAGDDLGAQQLVEAILTVEPATTARPRLERLRNQIRDHLIAETVISTTLVLEEKVLVPASRLRAKIVLENRTREDVTLRPGRDSPLGQVVLDYEELKPDGARSLRRAMRPVKVSSAGIKLAAHAKEEIALDLPTEHDGRTKGVLGRYRLSGRLRPYTLLAGEEPLPYFLPIQLVEIVVVDDSDRPLAEKPAESFAQAVKDAQSALASRSEADLDRSTHAGFTSALIWASQDRDAATRAIVQALEKSEGALARMLTAALARAVGEPGNYSKEEWLAWWKGGASRPRAGDDDEAPPPLKLPR